MPLSLLLAVAAAAGLALAAACLLALRLGGGHPGMARRLAGPRQVTVGALLEAGSLPRRPVRVAGRIRCADPMLDAAGQWLVALHRDVEVRLPGGWRSIERVRETRSFELWDHRGSLTVDPAQAAEPLVVIPRLWRGAPSDLAEPLAATGSRLLERHGVARDARAMTRTISLTDRLLVLAQPRRGPAGRVRLEPPPGGYLITNLALDDAMRLLGGRHRRLVAASAIGAMAGAGLAVVGVLGALAALALRA